MGQTALHPDSLLIPFPLEAAPLETRKVSLGKEGGPGGRVWEAPPPHTTWPPPTSTYGLGGGERQQTAKPSQTGVGFHGNQGARRRGGAPDPAVPLSTLPQALEPKLMPTQQPKPPICLLWGQLGLSCTLPCASRMAATWVLSWVGQASLSRRLRFKTIHTPTHRWSTVRIPFRTMIPWAPSAKMFLSHSSEGPGVWVKALWTYRTPKTSAHTLNHIPHRGSVHL